MVNQDDEILKEVHSLFIERVHLQFPLFQKFFDDIQQNKDHSNNLEEIVKITHQIAGTGKTFGYPKVSTTAKKLELLLESKKASKKDINAALTPVIEELKKVLMDNPSVAQSKENLKNTPKKHEKQFHILIVDDDPVMQNLVQQLLEADDIIVSISPTGEDALKKLKSQTFDLILLDMNMSGMDGEKTLEALKNEPLSIQTPVIMLTQKDDDSSIISCFKKGAIDYILKPIKEDEFKTKIKKTLEVGNVSILIADDDPLIQNLLKQKFERSGYKTYITGNGLDCIEMIKETKPNVVILDIMMPGRDGLSILREIKEHSEFSKIPFVLLTAKSQGENIIKGLESGAHDYVTKPFDIDELVTRVIGVLKNQGEKLYESY